MTVVPCPGSFRSRSTVPARTSQKFSAGADSVRMRRPAGISTGRAAVASLGQVRAAHPAQERLPAEVGDGHAGHSCHPPCAPPPVQAAWTAASTSTPTRGGSMIELWTVQAETAARSSSAACAPSRMGGRSRRSTRVTRAGAPALIA